MKAFDFCYTEVKTYQVCSSSGALFHYCRDLTAAVRLQQNKRMNRQEKQHEFSALVFDVPDYMFK